MSMPYESPSPVTPLKEHLEQAPLPLDVAPVAELAKVLRLREDVPVLEAVLREAGGSGMPWMNAEKICARLGWKERRVREVASASNAIASGPGSDGYALAEFATPEQLMHIGNALCSQADRMFARGQRLRTAATLRMKAAGITAAAEVHHEGTKDTKETH